MQPFMPQNKIKTKTLTCLRCGHKSTEDNCARIQKYPMVCPNCGATNIQNIKLASKRAQELKKGKKN